MASRRNWGSSAGGIGIVLAASVLISSAAEKDTADDAALVRTRKQVQVLDDVYKTAVVLITDKYVNEAR